MLEITSGRILVDDVALSSSPLKVLRSRITGVPQDPLILPGSVRYNVDPRGDFSLEQITRALEKVGILHHLPSETGIDTDLNGTNFSLGQQQLLALARVILRPSRIVVFDEATSNVDSETEKKMMSIINQELKGSTVVMVTHRLDHIETFDQIMVLADGKMAMIGTPEEVMASEDERVRRALSR